jgi:glycosyltransferase involved in cell wall biosynthesis
MTRKIHVLHVVGRMNRGGVETWLMHVLRAIDRSRYQLDFFVHTTEPSVFDEEITSLGSRIFLGAPPDASMLRYARRIRGVLSSQGPYDVVHSHHHHSSGPILLLAAACGVPVRIAHSHNDTRPVSSGRSLGRSAYEYGVHRLIDWCATRRVACSDMAGDDLFRPGWKESPGASVLYYSINLEPFRKTVSRSAIRRELGVDPDAFVIGHVGRFDVQKNHGFLLDVTRALVDVRPDAVLLLVGDGPLRAEIEAGVKARRLERNVVLAGVRGNVPAILKGAFDAMVFPSLHEGLPVVGLEAQAAGVPLIMSDAISTEVIASPRLVRSLSLAQPPAEWAQALLEHHAKVRRDPGPPLGGLEDGPFDIASSLRRLEEIYEPP